MAGKYVVRESSCAANTDVTGIPQWCHSYDASRRFRIATLILGALLNFFSASALAQQPASAQAAVVPPLINFSGTLVDVNNKPISGITGVMFSLYKESEGGSPLWMEMQNVQPDPNGHYSVMLGSTTNTGLPSDVFSSGEARWLGVKPDGQQEQPRVLLVAVPYALKAVDAETIGGLPASAFVKVLPGTESGVGQSGRSGASGESSGTTSAVSRQSVPPANKTVVTAPPYGTANYVPLWTGTNIVQNSTIFQSGGKTGVGTNTPRSFLEATQNVSSGTGPVLTLTNSTTNGVGGSTAIDLNAFNPVTNGKQYNATARILAFSDNYSADLQFLSNKPGSFNNGLQNNMTIDSNGQVLVNPNGALIGQGQLEVAAARGSLQTIYGITATGGQDPSGNGFAAVVGTGAPGVANTNQGGDGANFSGGNSPGPGGSGGSFSGGSSTGGNAGDGADFFGGLTSSTTGSGGYGISVNPGFNGNGTYAPAGFFNGDLVVTGSISAGTKDFKIDHPLDPANKYLVHGSIESSEMLNIYSGNVTTDELGTATVYLPDWFEAENTDFRYQLTVIGRFAQAIVAKEIQNHQFMISTTASHVKVSWQVTGVRQDAYAKAHPLMVEEVKPQNERGFYQNPELFGQPDEKQTEWARRPQQMQRVKELHMKQTSGSAANNIAYIRH